MELVRTDGEKLEGPEGRLLNVGHSIEGGCFLKNFYFRVPFKICSISKR
jgi:hypothetical protein